MTRTFPIFGMGHGDKASSPSPAPAPFLFLVRGKESLGTRLSLIYSRFQQNTNSFCNWHVCARDKGWNFGCIHALLVNIIHALLHKFLKYTNTVVSRKRPHGWCTLRLLRQGGGRIFVTSLHFTTKKRPVYNILATTGIAHQHTHPVQA